eukprot:6930162-Pyramimonas_sp.AAC.1
MAERGPRLPKTAPRRPESTPKRHERVPGGGQDCPMGPEEGFKKVQVGPTRAPQDSVTNYSGGPVHKKPSTRNPTLRPQDVH